MDGDQEHPIVSNSMAKRQEAWILRSMPSISAIRRKKLDAQ